MLGERVEFPILTAPCGLNALAHPDGELAVARATAAAGTIQVVSTAATYSLEEVAAAAPQGLRWFQLYCYRDRGITRSLVPQLGNNVSSGSGGVAGVGAFRETPGLRP